MSEIQGLNGKIDLKDIMRKCRCCLRLIIDERKSVDITEDILEQFFNLTTIRLLKIDVLTNRICQLCASDLETFSNLRNDLIEKQSSLYSLLGLELDESPETILLEEVSNKQEEAEKSCIGDQQFEYEIVEADIDDDEEEALWEETLEESSDVNNEENTFVYSEEEEPSSSILKIEKIEEDESNNKRSREEMELDQGDSNEYYEESLEEYDCSKVDSTLDEEVVHCDLCNIDILQTHVDLHSELMHIDLICQKCDKDFPSKILLKRHDHDTHSVLAGVKGHKSRRKYHFCGLCDKEYEYKKHLEDHVRSFHKRERNRQCPICLKFFYHRDIKKHIEHVHGEKKITCKVCGKLYTCMENLKLHMRYHDEPKYTCNIGDCRKKFHQKILFEHHILKHSTDKPVECIQCGSTFYTVRDLKRHTQRVHKKVTRKCFGCDLTFYRKDKYREHVMKHHKELTQEEMVGVLESIRVLKWNEEP